MKRWSQELLRDPDTKGVVEYAASWVRPGSGAQVTMQTRFLYAPEFSDALRSVCHQAIEALPDEGLGELCSTLGEMFEFYKERSIARQDKLPSPLTTMPALAGSTYERLPFHIEKD